MVKWNNFFILVHSMIRKQKKQIVNSLQTKAIWTDSLKPMTKKKILRHQIQMIGKNSLRFWTRTPVKVYKLLLDENSILFF